MEEEKATWNVADDHGLVVVSGASGVVGAAAAHEFIKHGRHVILLFRSNESRDKTLSTEFSDEEKKRISSVVATFDNDAEIEPLRTKLSHAAKEAGKEITHVVSSIGTMVFSSGPGVLTMPVKEVDDALKGSLIPHFVLAKALIPLIKNTPHSSYTIVTGGAGEKCFVPKMAPTTIKNAALFGLIQSIFAETEKDVIRVNELRIAMQLAKTDGNGKTAVHRVSPIFLALARGSQKGKVVKFSSVDEAKALF